ncbi:MULTISPECIES: winged helix DNA-binding domain-containing protein [Actinomadura]|uniref:Winged helix DNA-binding domain-containing protein n=2 Tax=Actinomadura yumaensis TaxID=111807 RepID=A0ABW2CRZ0_9ACTN|nr:winged helix DNA-binding domain-containing protein [Actinomadura sp. J1-007]
MLLGTGLQDYPPGRSAALALRLRTGRAPVPPTVLVHSIRGAMHLHRAGDLAALAAALRVEDGRELSRQATGAFAAELAADGVAFGAALDEVAAAMREAVSDGRSLTKGQLSGVVSPQVGRRFVPWCAGCECAHVQDLLFRLATLQAGLVIEVDGASSGGFRYRPAEVGSSGGVSVDAVGGRAELVRGFLAAFGPARPAQLASWLGWTPAAARSVWESVADELHAVAIDGDEYWTHAEHLELLRTAPAAEGVRLLPPYDPLTELADRPFLVPDAARRKAVWRAAANPGVLLVDGEIAGVWRQRRARDLLTVRVEPFAALPARRRRAAETDAATIADHAGASDVELVFA